MGKQGKFRTAGWFGIMKGISVSMMILILLSLFGCAEPSKEAGNETVELKLAHFFPATHPAEKELVQGWIEAIKEATGGRVIIKSYHGETLSKAGDIYGNVKEGVVDIGLSCFSYNAGRFPEVEVFEQPGIVYKNSKVASKVAWEGIQELKPACVQDTKLLMVLATGPGDLFTKKPVRVLEDIKGMQIRATGITADTLALLGATSEGMPQSEAYDALLKGVVEGNLAPIEVLKTWNHAEVTQYLTRTPFLYNNLFYITMNLDKWNALPDDIKTIITTVSETIHEEVAIGLWDKQNEEALEWAVNEQNFEVIDLTEEETARWIKAVEPMLDKFVQEKGESGQQALDTVKRLAEKYNNEY